MLDYATVWLGFFSIYETYILTFNSVIYNNYMVYVFEYLKFIYSAVPNGSFLDIIKDLIKI